jgi:hypothetical protein
MLLTKQCHQWDWYAMRIGAPASETPLELRRGVSGLDLRFDLGAKRARGFQNFSDKKSAGAFEFPGRVEFSVQ